MAKGTTSKNNTKTKVNGSKSTAKKPVVEEMDEESTKPKIIEVDTEDTDKLVDPELDADPLAVEGDESDEDEAGLDEEEIDPFGDKWEQ